MLVYVKDSSIQEILRDVSDEDVISKDLVVAEMTKEIEELARQDQYMEVTVFTPETLAMYEKYERGKPFFDSKYAMKAPFVIEKDKNLGDLVKLFVNSFRVSDEATIGVWYIDIKRETIRYIDEQIQMAETMRTLFRAKKPAFLVEMLSLEESPFNRFDKTEHAMLFFKQYDSTDKTLTYLSQRYFLLSDRIENIREYIRDLIGFSGEDEEIAVLCETGSDTKYYHSWIHRDKQIIKEFIKKNGDTHTATIVFEIVNDPKKAPRYASCTFVPNAKLPPSKENTIQITITQDTNTGEELLSQPFPAENKLADVIERLNELYVSIKYGT